MQIRTGPVYRTKELAAEAAKRLNLVDPVATWKAIPSARAPGQWTLVSERP